MTLVLDNNVLILLGQLMFEPHTHVSTRCKSSDLVGVARSVESGRWKFE
jgi:hypothetical protein